MAKITLKINKSDLASIMAKGTALEKELISESGAVYSYILTVGNGYQEAVISGMGKTISGTMSLKEFLGQSVQVSWKPNAPSTLRKKLKNHWDLRIWKATGEAERSVEVLRISSGKKKAVFAGIDGSRNPEGYEHAIRTEFGGLSDPGNKKIDRRALFTLLNKVFEGSTDKIVKEIEKRIAESIDKIWR